MSQGTGSPATRPVGVIGLGTMGAVIARALGDRHDVVVQDISAEARSRAHADGLEVAVSPEAVAQRASRVVLSLPNERVVDAVLNELLEASREDAPRLIVDTSTIGPGSARTFAHRAKAAGSTYVDAPILGRPTRVGAWTIPYGGEAEVSGAVEELLSPLATCVTRVGGPGAGAVLKVVNNQMLAAINAVTAEALLVAKTAGLDPAVFVDTVIDSGAASVSGLFRDVAPRAVAGDFRPTFALDLMCKDNALAATLADECDLDLGVTRAALALHQAAVVAGYGAEDSIAVLKYLVSVHEGSAPKRQRTSQ